MSTTSTTVSVSASASASASSTAVLYADHRGHLAPLSWSYHATASRVLSSALPWASPLSTSIEIDTAYCPQCLYYTSHASVGHRGTCPTCRSCPVCEQPLSVEVVVDDDHPRSGGATVYEHACAYCRWSSRECGATATSPPTTTTSTTRREDVVRALTERLNEVVEEKRAVAGASAETAFERLVSRWGRKAQEEERRRRYGEGSLSSARGRATTVVGGGPTEDWTVETLELSSEARRDALRNEQFAPVWDDNDEDVLVASSAPPAFSSVRNATLRSVSTAAATASPLLPLRVPLRPRVSRRCRAEAEAGRPGILVRPKTNPLEGDSSLRSGHGQWWKKDSSAVNIVPRVALVGRSSSKTTTKTEEEEEEGDGARQQQRTTTTTTTTLLLKVTNPTLGPVRLRLRTLEVREEEKEEEKEEEEVLRDLVLDHAAKRRVDAWTVRLPPDSAEDPPLLELEPVEDAFLELGKGRAKNAPDVAATRVDDNEDPKEGLFVAGESDDAAWYRLVASSSADDDDDDGDTGFRAVRLRLQIEVGNGSWESSLIVPSTDDGGAPDLVTFGLVLVWET